MPLSFSRKNRLISDADFQSVFRQSRKVARPAFIILYKPNQLACARLGMVVPKRHIKLSVHRHAWRRVVRESFRLHQARLAGLDMIVMAKAAWHSRDKQKFRAELDQAWPTVA